MNLEGTETFRPEHLVMFWDIVSCLVAAPSASWNASSGNTSHCLRSLITLRLPCQEEVQAMHLEKERWPGHLQLPWPSWPRHQTYERRIHCGYSSPSRHQGEKDLQTASTEAPDTQLQSIRAIPGISTHLSQPAEAPGPEQT